MDFNPLALPWQMHSTYPNRWHAGCIEGAASLTGDPPMRLSTIYGRCRFAGLLLGLCGALLSTGCIAAESLEPAEVAIATCPVTGGVDATLAADAERALAQPKVPQSNARPLDWRAMLPAVSLRGRY
jgi:hypothetical protein